MALKLAQKISLLHRCGCFAYYKKETFIQRSSTLKLWCYSSQGHFASLWSSAGDSNGNNTSRQPRREPSWLYIVGLGLASFTAIAIGRQFKLEMFSKQLIPSVNAASTVGPGGDNPGSGLRDKYNFIADVVDKVSPAVVFIENRYTCLFTDIMLQLLIK